MEGVVNGSFFKKQQSVGTIMNVILIVQKKKRIKRYSDLMHVRIPNLTKDSTTKINDEEPLSFFDDDYTFSIILALIF